MTLTATTKLVDGVRKLLRGLATAGLRELWIGGKPVPAGRPRVGRWGTYYPNTYTAWQKASWKFVEKIEDIVFSGPIAMLVEIICPAQKSPAVAPMGDVDNFAKGPLDLLTKTAKAWEDDRQITFLTIAKRFAEPGEEPGFKLAWCEI